MSDRFADERVKEWIKFLRGGVGFAKVYMHQTTDVGAVVNIPGVGYFMFSLSGGSGLLNRRSDVTMGVEYGGEDHLGTFHDFTWSTVFGECLEFGGRKYLASLIVDKMMTLGSAAAIEKWLRTEITRDLSVLAHRRHSFLPVQTFEVYDRPKLWRIKEEYRRRIMESEQQSEEELMRLRH